ncbi:MAG: acyl-CoA/acyl-ACP dehydrogenase [Hyphomicrobiaceae bacterium]|nr:acyl-CoA/acyl-ACP dehydrogenase [Hyphomicrobiaceae bacterium]
MDFALTEQQQHLRAQAREAIDRVVRPLAARLPKGGRLDAEGMRALYRGLAPLGYVGSTIPKDAGGAGLSFVDYGLMLEVLGASPVLLAEVVPPRSIYYLGNAEQKARWLSKLLAGDMVGTAAITEPQAGSDIRNLQTTAIREGGVFRLRGRKKWIKLGGIADAMTVLVVSDAAKGAAGGTSRLFVERERSPWTHEEIDCVGIRNLSFVEVHFDTTVPAENLLGDPGAASEAFLKAVEASRALVALQAAGIARHALDLAAKYVGTRHAFGRPLARFQSIQSTLADAEAEVEAGRLLALSALWRLDQGQRCPREASLAKVYVTEAAVRACHAAMDCMGAQGLAEESEVERCWRDARMLTVIDGTSGIQRLVAGREITGVSAFV